MPDRRKNVIRANSSTAALRTPKMTMDQHKNGSPRTNGRASRRRAAFAPPMEPDFSMDEEDLLIEKAIAQSEVLGDDEQWTLATAEDLETEEAVVQQGTISVVEAYYAAKTIDLIPMVTSSITSGATRKKQSREYILLELSPSLAKSEKENNPSYVVVYRFGAVIFFNVSPRVQVQMLQAVKRFATEPLPEGFEQKDSFGVCVLPQAPKTRVTAEHVIVPHLNMNAVSVISEVMAQSVALASYDEIVDSLLDKFAVLNSKISTSDKMDLDKKMLFSKIAQNNRIFIDLISKLRIKGRSQIAWDQGEYEIIHSGMTVEFDIDDRFELIQFKLDLIQQNSKLFLEVIQHQKSASLEWIIVVLIGFECVLMCLEMSGQGAVMFEQISNMLPK